MCETPKKPGGLAKARDESDISAEDYLAMAQDERVEWLKSNKLPIETFDELSASDQVGHLNEVARSEGAYYESGGIFKGNQADVLGVFNGIQASLESDEDEE